MRTQIAQRMIRPFTIAWTGRLKNIDGTQQPDGQEAGWDRADVFYQPAYDHCSGELGLSSDSQEYSTCYFAYPNYQPEDPQQPQEPQPDNDNQQPDGQEPGWDRADVFYQPAYDHCAGVLGLSSDSQEYSTCYFAYPNY